MVADCCVLVRVRVAKEVTICCMVSLSVVTTAAMLSKKPSMLLVIAAGKSLLIVIPPRLLRCWLGELGLLCLQMVGLDARCLQNTFCEFRLLCRLSRSVF